MRNILSAFILFVTVCHLKAADNVPVYSVYEMTFSGNTYKATDNPVRDVLLLTTWQNEKSHTTLNIHGFFDGNGSGKPEGNVFRVRFCPTEEGTWTLREVVSNDRKLNGQNKGFTLNAVKSDLHGFWLTDQMSPGRRWYMRSDGTHPYISGNTMYSFLSEYFKEQPTGGNIKDDISKNSEYFNKVRIGITGDRYPNPSSKPFLDETGKPTDDGNYSHRPNTEWFFNRLDLAVKTGFEKDIITDLILNGPDTKESRSALVCAKNNYDPAPLLRYIAARYGSYPNVWICLSNEFDIKEPVFSPSAIAQYGEAIQSYLPYETPVSVHAVRYWTVNLNTTIPWFDHTIVQNKLKKIDQSSDAIRLNYTLGGSSQPVINDELAYEGAGDGWSEEDVIEAFLGAFAGGGYASTGHKTAEKEGHYFAGNFIAEQHKAADNLKWFRAVIDRNITFWEMEPVDVTGGENIFRERFDTRWRVIANKGQEYVLAANWSGTVLAKLPAGEWTIRIYDLITMKEEILAENASGDFEFSLSKSRAQMVHLKRIK